MSRLIVCNVSSALDVRFGPNVADRPSASIVAPVRVVLTAPFRTAVDNCSVGLAPVNSRCRVLRARKLAYNFALELQEPGVDRGSTATPP